MFNYIKESFVLLNKFEKISVIFWSVALIFAIINMVSGCRPAKGWVGTYYAESGEYIDLFYNGEVMMSYVNNPNYEIYYVIVNSRICFDVFENDEPVGRKCYKYTYVTNDSMLVGEQWFVKK